MKRFDMAEAPVDGTNIKLYTVIDSMGWYRFDWMGKDAMHVTCEWLNQAHDDGRLFVPAFDTLEDGTMLTAHDHIDPMEFREAQRIAQKCGVDPYNSADRVWAAHGYLKRVGQCIFAARRDELPSDDTGALMDALVDD